MHNEFLEMTIHFGMLGTAGLFTTILLLWKRAAADIPFQGVLSGIVFAGFFDVYLSHQRLALLVVLLIYLIRHIMESTYYNRRSTQTCQTDDMKFYMVKTLFLFRAFYLFNDKTFCAQRAFNLGLLANRGYDAGGFAGH